MRQFSSNLTDEHLRTLMKDPRYWKDRDPAYVEMIQQGFKDLYDTPSQQARAAEGEAANELGLNGRHHAQDTMIAHVTPGEIVIPLSAQTPKLMQYLSQILGEDMVKFTVGSGHEQQNPTSGLRAFADEDPELRRLNARVQNLRNEIAYLEEKIRNENDKPRKALLQIQVGNLKADLKRALRELEDYMTSIPI